MNDGVVFPKTQLFARSTFTLTAYVCVLGDRTL